MRYEIAVLAVGTVILLGGCALSRLAVPTAIDAERVLEPDLGLVVLDVELSHDVPYLSVVPATGNGEPFHLADLKKGVHLMVIAVRSGDYRFRRVKIMGYRRRREMVPYDGDLNEENPFLEFSVKPGAVNYPGRLVVTRRGTRLSSFTLNRSGEVAERLRDDAEWLLLTYPVAYTGRRRDNFLPYYSERLKAARGKESAELSGGDRVAD